MSYHLEYSHAYSPFNFETEVLNGVLSKFKPIQVKLHIQVCLKYKLYNAYQKRNLMSRA